MHGSRQQGIYNKDGIVYSVVMSGGYEDDQDYGNVLSVPTKCQASVSLTTRSYSVYTGVGGQGSRMGKDGRVIG